MIIALLLAAAAPADAVEAERAFAERAQTEGMWTAFRATAAEGAIMFVPKPTKAQAWLKGRKDPPQGYMWWPGQAYVSCDGAMAVTTGPSVLGKARGYFTTLWERRPDGEWRWLFDHGDALEKPRSAGEQPRVRKATCKGLPRRSSLSILGMEDGLATGIGAGSVTEKGTSADGSLKWEWTVAPDGSRTVAAYLWNGSRHEPVLQDVVRGRP
ncbi:MAG TPA: hypothetical protein VGB59_03735 [Allosphingosinicella sp.]|jgi:hypothetical protein